MRERERSILESAVRVVSEQAAAAGALVDEAVEAGLDGSHPVTVHAKMLRPEGALGLGPECHTRSLGAPGARAT